jgi:DNA-binding NarL/FixJ family response regulator
MMERATDAPRHRLFLADDQALFRAVVRVALDSQSDLKVVGESGDGQQVMSELRRCRADVVVVDVNLPGRNGFEICADIKAAALPVKVLAMSDTADEKTLVKALEAGADGYVTREGRLADMVGGVRAVLNGEACVPRRMLGSLLQNLIKRRRATDHIQLRYDRLSKRERETLALLGHGHDHESIAREMVISPQTARTHIQNVLSKLEVHSRLEAAALAVEYDFTDPARKDERDVS